jgi:hypothetical protein
MNAIMLRRAFFYQDLGHLAVDDEPLRGLFALPVEEALPDAIPPTMP